MTGDIEFDDLPTPEYEGTVAPDDLHVDGDNPNEMADETFGLLCDRLRDNGWLGGPVVTDTDGLIADGEHRWRAAQEIGLSEVPVRQYDIDDATRRLWRQELNKIHGEHDSKRDALEYDELLSAGYTEEVEAVTEAAGEDLDELLARIRVDSSVGPRYEYDSEHNVYFEDCVDGMRERLDDDSVDMVFTSPPYNVEVKENYQVNESDHDKVTYIDDRDDGAFRAFLQDVFSELARVVKPGGHVFINFQNDIRDGTVNPPTEWLPELVPLPWRSYVVWDKGTSATINGKLGEYGDGVYAANWEPILHFSEAPRPLNGKGGDQLGVWDIPASNREFEHETGDHPAPFPVALVTKAIRTATTEGDTVLDPFMGSGTTAVAAIETNRSYVGFEVDEKGAYKPIIERRIGEAKRQREASVNSDE